MPEAKSAPTRRELIDRLAPLIWQERQREAEYDQLLQLFNMLIAVIRENGGELVIGDDVIGRANARYMQDRSIVTGGAVF